MKKIYLILLNIVFVIGFVYNLSAQTSIEENNVVRADLNMMFARLLVQEKPITGLLRDYAVDLVDLDDYDGTKLNDSTFVNHIIFEDILRTINSSSVLEEKPIEALPMRLRHLEETDTPSEVRIGVALYDYNYIPANAVETNRIRCVGGIVLKGGAASPYEFNQVFAMTVGSDVCKSMSVDYNFYGDNLYTNIADAAYLFDAGDGNGWRTMDPNSGMRITYTEEGEKELKMLALLQDGRELISHSKIYIINPNTNSELGTAEPCKLPGYERCITYGDNDDVSVKVEARVSYSCKSADGKFRKPFIIVEGFDPWELMSLLGIKGEDYYMSYKQGFLSYGGYWSRDDIGLFQNSSLSDEYDFVYIDWYNSTADIRANAQLLINIIEEINENKIGTEGGILMGQSMGGLIARYALSSMENDGKIHGITTFVSHDAPHLGVNVPLGVQYFIQQLICMLKGQIGLVNIEDIADYLIEDQIGEKISAALDILHSPAAQQMMYNYVNKNGVLDNTLHEDLMDELDTLGFPKGDPFCKMECLSIVNGGQYDYRQMLAANQHLLLIDGYAKTKALISLALSCLDYIFAGSLNVITNRLLGLPIFCLGSDRLNIHAEVNPLISANVGQTLSALSLVYTKRFLWLFPKTYSLFNSNITIPYSSLFYDEYPGSTYSKMLSEIKDQIDSMTSSFEGSGWWGEYNLDMAITKGITFIPTASALCIKNGESVAHSDYMKNYYTDHPAPKDEVPFDAYYLWDMASEHIECNAEVLDWIYKQANMKIEGADFVGEDGSADYTITGYEGNVEWSTSDSNIATIDASGRLTAHNFGVVTVVAQVPYANGKLYRKNKCVSIGFPDMVITKSFEIGLGYKFVASTTDPNAQENLNQIVNDGILQYEWSVIDSDENMTTYLSSNNYLVYLPDVDEAVSVYVRLVETGTGNKSVVKSTSFNLQTLFDLNYDYAAIGADGFAYLVNIEQNTLDGEAQETAVRFNYGTKLRISLKNALLDSTTNSSTTQSMQEMLDTYIKGSVCYLKYGDTWTSNYLTGTKVPLYNNKWDFDFFDHDIFIDNVSEVVSEANGEDRVLATIPLIICNSEYENLQFVPFHIVYKSSIGQN